MNLWRLFWRGLAFAAVGCFINQSLHAQDEDGGAVLILGNGSGGTTITDGSGTEEGGTLSIGNSNPLQPQASDILAILPADSQGFLPTTQTATAGSTLVFNLDLLGGGVAPVNSFTISFSNEPYLTLSDFTSDLPAGYTYTYDSANNVFTAQNVSGTDLSSSTTSTTTDGVTTIYDTETTLATLTFTVDPNTPIGTTLNIPSVDVTSSLLDDGRNTISTSYFSTDTGPAVVVPEPSIMTLIGSGCCALTLLLAMRRRHSSVAKTG